MLKACSKSEQKVWVMLYLENGNKMANLYKNGTTVTHSNGFYMKSR